MIPAIITAAGLSARMGQPKALLPHIDPRTSFVTHLIQAARAAAADPILVVGRPADEATRRAAESAGARFTPNHHADEGQLSSVIAGLDALEGSTAFDAVLIMPVDVPLVTSDVIARLIERAAASPAAIVRATHGGRHGHPVIFKRGVFAELRAADPSVGAKAVVRRDPRRVLDVEVEEPGVVEDVDTPADYERLFGRPVPLFQP